MNWIKLPDPRPDMEAWGAFGDRWQYVLSHDKKSHRWGVTAKLLPEERPPFERVDLGFRFATRHEAEAVVERHERLQGPRTWHS